MAAEAEETSAVFNLEVVMLACEGKLSLHEENHAWIHTLGFSTTLLLAQDVSAANVGSIATLSHSSSQQHKTQHFPRSVPIGYYQVLLFRSYDM